MSCSTTSNKLGEREAESQVWDGCGFFSTAELKAWQWERIADSKCTLLVRW